MAEKRMFSAKIIESDAFLDIPATAQMLYFHICMNTDDDGFVVAPLAGARIEILISPSSYSISVSLPSRERGLKCHAPVFPQQLICRSPRGSAD